LAQKTDVEHSVLLDQYFVPLEGKFKGMEFRDEII
jgi:hypothetical protein